MRKSLNIVPIDKPKSSIAPIFGNPLEEETTFKEEDDIEEDDFEEDTNFSSGKIPFSIKREKIALTISLNKLTKFHISPIFINFHIHFDGFGLLT